MKFLEWSGETLMASKSILYPHVTLSAPSTYTKLALACIIKENDTSTFYPCSSIAAENADFFAL